MCGIAGFAGADARARTLEMVGVVRHRGPDRESIWCEGNVCLGHAHLKVTGDVEQPVLLDNRAVVYNGEIYNFGEFLPGHSDTAALADVILKDGVDSFLRAASSIDGEYAFAYYDGSGLMLARDPAGIKPLFYGYNRDGFGFASEKKALMRAGVREVKALSPGHIYYKGAELKAISLPPCDPVIKDVSEASGALEEALARSVELRAHKDAAVAFSGGVDCSLIGAMSGLPLCTVGIRGSYDVQAARKAASLMGVGDRHTVYEFDEDDVEEALPAVIYAVESADPMRVSIALPLFILAREARREGYRVLLSGQGADELFGGYARHESAAMNNTLPGALQHDLEHIAEVNLERDDAAAMAHGMELRVPYLDLKVVSVAQRTDPSLKVYFDGKNYIRKYVLRKMSEKYLPHEVSYAPKKAIQYGTGVSKTIERLALKRNFKGIDGYLQSLSEGIKWPLA
ncbi:MAG TPA: asparagine synthetase B [Methanocella sp.]|nr:asparagine synthetase B [Methanocella sp.]